MQDRLGRQAAKGVEQAFVGRMAEDDEAHGTQHVCPVFGKERPPAELAQQVEQSGLARQHDDPALVEMGQRVALAATHRAGRRHRLHMARADGQLGLRKAQPDQRVEEIMPVSRPRLDLAGIPDAAFIDETIGLRRNETDAPAIRRKDRESRRQRGDCRRIRRRRQLPEPAAQRIVKWRSKSPGNARRVAGARPQRIFQDRVSPARSGTIVSPLIYG